MRESEVDGVLSDLVIHGGDIYNIWFVMNQQKNISRMTWHIDMDDQLG